MLDVYLGGFSSPTQDAIARKNHQDDWRHITYFRLGNPELNLHFANVARWGVDLP